MFFPIQKKKYPKLLSLLFYSLAFIAGAILSSAASHVSQKSKLQVSGFPTIHYNQFSLQYDSKHKIPLWTYEYLDKSSLNRQAQRNGMQFNKDNSIYPLHQSALSDYYQSGYDRGHMAPAADHQYSKEALEKTFLLSNICPQHASLNRGIWNTLEQNARGFVKENQSVEIVTGPLFLSTKEGNKRYIKYEVIGNGEVAVPTHFFKLIMVKGDKMAYIIPNHAIDPKATLEQFQVSIEMLEKVSGLHFKFKN